MTKPIDTNAFGKEAMDNGLKSIAAFSKGAQGIAAATSEYVKKSVEDGTAAWQQIAQAKSFEKAVEIQSSYAKSAYEGFVTEARKLTELYADMAKEAYKPYEAVLAKAK